MSIRLQIRAALRGRSRWSIRATLIPVTVLLLINAVLTETIPAAALGLPSGPARGTTLAAPGQPGPPGRFRPAADFSWPLPGTPPVLRAFQPPRTPYGPGHRGVDLGGTVDEDVLAAADGLVVFSGVLAGRGVVSIEHEGGLRSTYEPLRPTAIVGVRVRRGERIGLLDGGHPGCPVSTPQAPPEGGSGAACLHWGLRRRLDYLNPVWRTGRVRLLSWDE